MNMNWARSIGGAVKKIPGALARPGMDGDDAESFRTPGINPNAPLPPVDRPAMRATPTAQRPSPIPAAPVAAPSSPSPRHAPLAPTEPRGQMPGLNEAVNVPSVTPAAPSKQAESVRAVPVPRLPGQKGDPRILDDYGRAKYESQMEGRRGTDGGISTRGPDGNFHDNKAKGIGWKGGFQNAFIGMQNAKAANPNANLFEMLGGALGGGVRAKTDPDEGRGRLFDTGQGKQMLQDQKRMDVRTQHELAQEKMRLENERIQAQTEQVRGNTKDSELERKYRLAQINRANAEAQAKMTGKPQLTDDYDEQTDQIRKVAVYPDGRVVVVGQSGAGQLRREGIESREGIARDRNAAAMERTQVQQEGARERAVLPRAGRSAASSTSTSGIPTEARQEHTRIQGLKRKADAAWAKAKTPTQGADAAALADVARAAQEDYNRNADDFGKAYGDFYEVGPGEGGWAYVKPKAMGSSGSTASQSGGSRGPTAKLSDLTKYLQ